MKRLSTMILAGVLSFATVLSCGNITHAASFDTGKAYTESESLIADTQKVDGFSVAEKEDYSVEGEKSFVIDSIKSEPVKSKIHNVFVNREKNLSGTGKGRIRKLLTANDSSRTSSAVNPEIYYGTLTGSLSKGGDYNLYSFNLAKGNYLQTRLTIPEGSSINYDLYLFDSSFNIIKGCDYYTVTTSTEKTLPESVGYIAPKDETIYACVFASSEASADKTYTLDYSLSTFVNDDAEPNENAVEAKTLSYDENGVSFDGKICSPLDSDWYILNVPDSPRFHAAKFDLNLSDNTNGCNIEIYSNVVENAYGMLKVAEGNGGDIELDAGKYYIKVAFNGQMKNFYSNKDDNYHITIKPVSRVDGIKIKNISGFIGTKDITYNEGTLYRIEEVKNVSSLTVEGYAWYMDGGKQYPAVNGRVFGKVTNFSWQELNQLDRAYMRKSSYAGSNGMFSMDIYLTSGKGKNYYNTGSSGHWYDIMRVDLSNILDGNSLDKEYFYYLVQSSYYGY